MLVITGTALWQTLLTDNNGDLAGAKVEDRVVNLIEDSNFFESLVEDSSDAIVTIDENSRIVYANQSVERVFGYEPEDLIGEPLTTVMPQSLVKNHHQSLTRYLSTGERTLDWNDVRFPGKHADGHELQLSITFEEHEYQNVRLFSGIIRDVTRRVNRERELERKNEQLERFASIVSHDLRGPLKSARALLDLVRKSDDEEYLDELEAVHERMMDIVDDVLTLTREGDAIDDVDRVVLGDVVRDAWSTVGTEEASLTVVDEVAVVADRARLRTLLENVLGNAVHHGDSTVSVRVGALPENVGFYVADDGPGVDGEYHGDVFEYGFTTSDEGTGLGLSIVRDVAHAHGWSVEMTDSLQGGARVEVRDVEIAE